MYSAIFVMALVASVACVPLAGEAFDDCTVEYTTTATSDITASSESLPATTEPLKEHHRPHHRHPHRHPHHRHDTTSVLTIPNTVPVSSMTTTANTLLSSTTSKAPITTSAAVTSQANPSPPSDSSTSFPYPSGSTYVDGWTWTYSAPTQTTWTAPTGSFQTAEHVTSYPLTSTDSSGSTYVTTTTTTEAACTPAAADYTQTALTLHNEYRANHTANPLVWDDSLACIAQRQANACLFDHLMYVDDGGYGQNIAGGGGVTVGPSVEMWYSEAPNFAPYYGEANPGGDFGSYGHFTQLVWAYTTSVGCATVDCGDGNGQPDQATSDFTVCNYYAAGNMGGFYGVYVLPPAA